MKNVSLISGRSEG